MNIALDMMGGDFAPEQVILGVARYFAEVGTTDVHVLLIGNPEAARPFIHHLDAYKANYTLVPASQVIGMDEHPTKALKEKTDSSIAVGFGALARGKADAFLSAGNTGAMMVGAMYSVKTIDGILRPTIASPLPCADGTYNLLLDVGINADCKPEHLVQFALLGSLYMKHVLGKEHPKVGLLNLGEEEGKGNLLAQATYPLLKECTDINFVGNVEGRDMFRDKADVIVCEGFVGNVCLKMAESIYQLFNDERGFKDEVLNNFNYEIYGGTPILGINNPVLIGHGISSAFAFRNMIEVATKIVRSGLVEDIKQQFKA